MSPPGGSPGAAGGTPRQRAWARAEALVEHRRARVLLAALIVASLLPFPTLAALVRPALLVVFGIEVAVRLPGFLSKGYRSPTDWLFFVVDLAALVGLLPVERWLGGVAPWVPTVLRLAWLLVLARLARTVGRDIWTVVTRREQLQQFGLISLAVSSLAFTAAVILGELAVTHDYDGVEGARPEGFGDRLWWAFRQIESPDNLVENLHVHPLVGAVSLLLTIVGVFIISFLIGLGTNIVRQVVRAERRRPVGYHRHSLVVGPIDDSEVLVREFARIYDKNRGLRRVRAGEVWRWLSGDGPPPRRHALPRMALLGPSAEPPDYLVEPEMRWVVYRSGEGADAEALDLVSAATAKRVMLLAHHGIGEDADAVTLASLMAIRERNPVAHVFVEVLESRNAALAASVGGPGTHPLDVPRFMGLFLCHHLLAPGIEGVFADLLTAAGSELYTHVFVEAEEGASLERAGARAQELPFLSLAAAAYHRHGALLVGAFLGAERPSRGARGLIPVDRLEHWLNPLAVAGDERRVAELGGRPGRLPVRSLAGLVALAETYLPLRRYAQDLAAGRGFEGLPEPDPTARAAAGRIVGDVRIEDRPLRRVLILGWSPSLPSLLEGLGRFVEGVSVTWLVDAPDGSDSTLARRLASAGAGFEVDPDVVGLAKTARGVHRELSRGGSLDVHAHLGRGVVASLAGRRFLREGAPFDAVVFLSEPAAADRDARTLTRVLRFARILDHRDFETARRLHVLAEFESVARGEGLRRHLSGHHGRVRLTLVSTERIHNYFMVHSAFVPGVMALYDRLLGSTGDELLRLELVDRPREGEVGLWDLVEALAPQACLPLAVELAGGEVVLNPPPDARFRAADLRGLYALGDSDVLPGRFPDPGDSVLPPEASLAPPSSSRRRVSRDPELT